MKLSTYKGRASKRKGHGLKVLFVLPSISPDTFGGHETQYRLLRRHLAAQDVESQVLAPTVRQEPLTHRQDGINRIVVPSFPNLGGRHAVGFLLWTLRSAVWVWRHRSHYDAIYVFHARLHAFGPALGGRLGRRPVFIKLGGGGPAFEFLDLRRKRYLYGRAVEYLMRRWSCGFIANSSEIYRDLLQAGVPEEKIFAIPNGVESPGLLAVSRWAKHRSGRVFLFSGRLEPVKRIDVILGALATVISLYPDTRLHILGAGSQLEELKALTAQLGLGRAVEFIGYVEETSRHMQHADFYISAALKEGQSNALLEAMAHGLIPIVAPASGVTDCIRGPSEGFVAASGSPASLSASMISALGLSSNKRATMQNRVARATADRFSISSVAAMTARVLTDQIE